LSFQRPAPTRRHQRITKHMITRTSTDTSSATPSLHASLVANGVDIVHHFGGGVYMKETRIPAGKLLTQHRHKHDHLSILLSGRALLQVNDLETVHEGPCVIRIEAGEEHSVTSLTDIVWFCIHPTNETDPDKVDAEVVL